MASSRPAPPVAVNTAENGVLPSCLRAILSADAEGYSLKMDLDERRTHQAVKSRLATLHDLVRRHDGSITSQAGDGFIAHFPSILGGVQCSIDMQLAMEDCNAHLSKDEQILFRIGVHLGEVILDGDEVSGTCVNVADRLQKLATAGGILISHTVYEMIENTVDVGFQCIGEQYLKNITKPLMTYRIVREAQAGSRLPHRRSNLPQPSLPRRPSIAVLPFENMSRDPEKDFFTEGITEDLITNLSRFRDLFVIARDSSFAYSAQRHGRVSVKEIGVDLGIRYVLNGSVRWAGDERVRISTHLADSINGVEIWSESYDKTLRDVFAVQDEVTREIATHLSVRIEATERDSVAHSDTGPPEAYRLFLKGQSIFLHYTKKANQDSRRLFEQATELAPSFARAYGALAKTYGVDWRFSWGNLGDAALDRALELARKAVSLDHADSRGHSELGFVYLYKKQLDVALNEYASALALNPNDADVMAEMADALVYAGRCEEAVELLIKAMRLNPYYPDWYLWYLGGAYFQNEQFKKAIETLLQMTNPTEGRRLLAASYAHMGHLDEAKEQARLVRQAHPQFYTDKWRTTQPFKNSKDLERLISGLRMAGLE